MIRVMKLIIISLARQRGALVFICWLRDPAIVVSILSFIAQKP